jgi:hypothetical protein
MQVQVGGEFPYGDGVLQGKEALNRIEAAWLALAPLLPRLSVCDTPLG